MFSNRHQEWRTFVPPNSGGTFQWMGSSGHNHDPTLEQLQRVGLEETMANIALSLTKLGLEKNKPQCEWYGKCHQGVCEREVAPGLSFLGCW